MASVINNKVLEKREILWICAYKMVFSSVNPVHFAEFTIHAAVWLYFMVFNFVRIDLYAVNWG